LRVLATPLRVRGPHHDDRRVRVEPEVLRPKRRHLASAKPTRGREAVEHRAVRAAHPENDPARLGRRDHSVELFGEELTSNPPSVGLDPVAGEMRERIVAAPALTDEPRRKALQCPSVLFARSKRAAAPRCRDRLLHY
jgi:hypothetical protein